MRQTHLTISPFLFCTRLLLTAGRSRAVGDSHRFAAGPVAAAAARTMSQINGHDRSHEYKKASFYENWLLEYDTWPLITCIAFAVLMGSAVGLDIMMTSPDVCVKKKHRKAIFRGELQDYLDAGDTEAIKQYLHIDDT